MKNVSVGFVNILPHIVLMFFFLIDPLKLASFKHLKIFSVNGQEFAKIQLTSFSYYGREAVIKISNFYLRPFLRNITRSMRKHETE